MQEVAIKLLRENLGRLEIVPVPQVLSAPLKWHQIRFLWNPEKVAESEVFKVHLIPAMLVLAEQVIIEAKKAGSEKVFFYPSKPGYVIAGEEAKDGDLCLRLLMAPYFTDEDEEGDVSGDGSEINVAISIIYGFVK